MSTSLKVVSIAALSWACLSLLAIVSLSLVIFIFSSWPNFIFRSEGPGLMFIKLNRSPFETLPPLPVPWIFFKSILLSAAIFLTAGETDTSFVFLDFSFLEDTSSVSINGSSLLVFSLGSEIFSSLSNSFVSTSFVSTSFFKLIILSSLCTTFFSSLGSFSISSFFELPPIIDPRTAPTSTVEPF